MEPQALICRRGRRLPDPVMRLRDQQLLISLLTCVGSSPGAVTVCPIGPLTNIALAIAGTGDRAKNQGNCVDGWCCD
ncbi:MAG: hypothetical protein CM1200mP41_27340 [Gammaproteobacteria bacterium]|nr:MAG: hypothetical protein CM1200mP41_27340 [Gammaproteobacteria bacterium]